MTLEELEIVVKADVSDATKKLSQLKDQIQDKVQTAVEQTKPAFESVKTTITNFSNSTSKELEIATRQIELQAEKVQKLKEAYLEEQKYAKAYAKINSKNLLPPDVEGARAKLEQAQIQLEKMELRAGKLQNKLVDVGKTAQKTGTSIEKAMSTSQKTVTKTTGHLGKLFGTLTRIIKLMIIRKIIRATIEGFNDLAQYSNRFNKSMSEMKSALLQARNSIATAFAPIIQALTPIIVALANAITYLFTALAQLTTVMFTNNTTFTKAKKVTTEYGQAVGKANGQLAKFDELNVISDPSGGGGTSPQDMFEEAQIDSRLLELKEKIKDILNSSDGLYNGIKTLIDEIYQDIIAPFMDTLTNYILPVVIGVAREISNTLIPLFKAIGNVVYTVWEQGIRPIIQTFMKIWSSVWESIKSAWDKWGTPIFEHLRTAIEKAEEVFNSMWDNALKPILDYLLEKLTQLWDEHLKPLWDNLLDFFGEVIVGILVLYNEVIAPFFTWFWEKFGPTIVFTINNIIDVVTSVWGIVADVINGVIRSLKGIVQFIVGVFTGDWEKAWEGVKNIFGGVWDGIVAVVKGVINLIIDMINKMLDAIQTALNWIVKKINSIKVTNPITGEVIWSPSLEEFDFSKKKISKLARGGVITEPTTILAGEYAGASQNPEIVTPQKLLLETSTQANVPVMNAIEEMGDKLVTALNTIGVYAEFDYSKLKVGLDNENYRVGGKLYGI